jgi:trans-aconitate methyltransferase
MTHRALELMAIPPDQTLFLMDIGCGSGLSGEILEELGHIWVGLDIAPSMLGPLPLSLLPRATSDETKQRWHLNDK